MRDENENANKAFVRNKTFDSTRKKLLVLERCCKKRCASMKTRFCLLHAIENIKIRQAL